MQYILNAHWLAQSLVLTLTIIACGPSLYGGTLRGRVHGTSGSSPRRIRGAYVRLNGGLQQAATDSAGEFIFHDVHPGTYVVDAHCLGFQSSAQSVIVNDDTTDVSFSLQEAVIQTNYVVITAEREPSTTLESPIAVAVQGDRSLDAQRGQSIAGSIDLLPGVREFTGGPVASKPVLRGLTSQRVLVAQDGVRMGSQSWDEPQAPEMTAFNVDRIEVVRGPNSVMFGSDALGGVVNVIRKSVFAQSEGKVNGLLELNGFSNNKSGAGSVTLGASSGKMAFRANVNGRVAGEYEAPGGMLPNGTTTTEGEVFNSGASEFGAGVVGGIQDEWGTVTLDLSHFGQEIEITPVPGRMEIEEDPDTGELDTLPASPVQEIMHERAALASTLFAGTTRFDVNLGFQYNQRKEEGVNREGEGEEEEEEETPEVKLDLYTSTVDAKAVLQDIATVGVSVLHQRNQTLGRHAIIPDYTQLNLAGYAYREQPIVDAVRAMASVRFDHRTLDASQNLQLESVDTSLSYDAFSGNVGLSWMPIHAVSITGNVGTGWRAPVAAELFGNGEDEGEVRYKKGNATLQPERSLNTEFGIHASTSWLTVELAAYRNSITDFIGLQPTGQVEHGLPVYSYFQTQATILGIEFSADVQVLSWLSAGTGVDVLKGDDLTRNMPLPLMPANRVQCWLTYHNQGWDWLNMFTASLRPRFVLGQSRIATGEVVTPAYTLIDASLGGILQIGGTGIRTDLVIQNMLNTAYVDHLSRYKAYAMNPGLNVSLKVAVPIL